MNPLSKLFSCDKYKLLWDQHSSSTRPAFLKYETGIHSAHIHFRKTQNLHLYFVFYIFTEIFFSFASYNKSMFSVLVILSRGSKKCCPKVFMLPMESRQLSSYTSVSSQRKWNSRDKWIFQWTCSNNWRKESCSFYFSGLKQLCHNYFIPIKFHLISTGIRVL